MQAILRANLAKIEEICRKRSVSELYSFGSVNTDQFKEESDVDFLVEFKEIVLEEYADNYLDMCYDLEAVLNRKVDLVTTRSVKNPIFKKEIDLSKELIYTEEAVSHG